MTDEHTKIIKDYIDETFELMEKVSEFEINNSFQLQLAQLDLFKVISSLVIGITAIGYIFSSNFDNNYLLISVGFALLTLIFSVSYTREIIDLQREQDRKTNVAIKKVADEGIKVAMDSLKKNDSSIFFNYVRNRIKDKYPEQPLVYTGEIMVFIFYSSVGFLILSFLARRYEFTVISYQTLLLLITTYFLSFKNWSVALSTKLSKNIKKQKIQE